MRVSLAEQEAVVERFLAAVRGGDLQGLLDVLAPDVVAVADGGGVVTAARRPVEGAARVGTALLNGLAKVVGDFQAVPMWLNGRPAARFEIDGELDTVVSLVIEDGRITRFYAVRNPSKLARVDEEVELSR